MVSKKEIREELFKIREQKSIVQAENNKLKIAIEEYNSIIADKLWWPYPNITLYHLMIKNAFQSTKNILEGYIQLEFFLESKLYSIK